MTDFLTMPKVELHLHLDGSLDINSVKNKYNLTAEQVNEYMIANDKCKNLNDYLTKFDYPISIMQTEEEIEDITINLLKSLKSQNVIYCEIRFAPQFHTRKGLSQEEVIKTVLRAKEKVEIKSNFILCLMRGEGNESENMETLSLAEKYLGKGVCAIDLAGAEAIYKTKDYEKYFNIANEKNIPFTIHAGEADGPDSIKAAIKFGTKRIGHGVRVVEDKELLDIIIDRGITLEVCPTSNIQTCICDSYKTHPIKELYEAGVKVTINTDNMTVSNTTLSNEYTKLNDEAGITKEDIIKMNLNSVDAAFITNEEKEELKAKIKLGE